MTTQYTSILKLALPVQGELSGTWGDVVNDNITSMVEEAVAGRAVINSWTTNSHTLTTADGTTSESRCAMLEFTDTGAALTGAATVVCPSASKLYVCKNDAGQQVTIKTAAGTGVAIPDGETMFVFCDGTNVEQCETNFNSLSFNGYTLNFGGAVTTAGAFTTSGAYALTLTTTGATNVTLPTTGTLATLDGTETLTNKTLTGPTISSPTLTGSISATDLTISGNTTIGDASADTLTVNATITSNLLFTDATYDIGATGATRPRDLFLSRNAVLGGTLTTTGNVTLGADTNNVGSFSVNTDKLQVAAATGNTTIAGTLGVTGATTATGGLNVDTINEITSAGGVTIDSVLLKDDVVNATDIETNTISANDGTTAITILASADAVGLGVTPTASWNNAIFGLQVGTSGAAYSSSTSQLNLLANSYYGASGFNYLNTDEASAYTQVGGAHTFYVAPSGTADAAITWTEALHIDNSGNVIVNEDAGNQDFRVESDNNANMLFVDAANDVVYFNGNANSVAGDVKINGIAGIYQDSTVAEPQIRLATVADSGATEWALGNAVNSTSLKLAVYNASWSDVFTIDTDRNFTYNPNNFDANFRVETSGQAYTLSVDGGTDRVNIHTAGSGSTGALFVSSATSANTSYSTETGVAMGGSTSTGAVEIFGATTGGSLVDFSPNDGTTDYSGRIIYSHNDSTMKFFQNATERMVFKNTENVFNDGGFNHDFRIESDTNSNMLFVDASGGTVQVGHGNTGYAELDVQGDISIRGPSNFGTLEFRRGTSSLVFARIGFDDPSASNDTFVIDSSGNGNPIGLLTNSDPIYFWVGADTSLSADVRIESTGSMVINENGNDSDFRVESDGESGAIMVDAGNNEVYFGKTSGDGTVRGGIMNFNSTGRYYQFLTDSTATSTNAILYLNRQSSDGVSIYFRRANSGVGNISVTTSGTTYNTTSDRRLKIDIQPIADATDKLMAMNPVSHKWIADPEADAVHGFIAQEMQEIVPEAVSGTPDGEEMMSMDYGRITPVLVAALQDAHKKIAELEARLNQMEGK